MKAKILLLFLGGIISSIQLISPVSGQQETTSPDEAQAQEDDGTDVVQQPMDEKVDEHWIKNKAKTLDTKSFDESVFNSETSIQIEGNPWFIKFYAPWCTHCKRIEPVWDDFHTKFGEEINIAKVDCAAQNARDLCDQFHINTFPTMLFIKDNKTYEYQYERDIDLLYKFTQEGYTSIPVTNIKAIPPRLDDLFDMYLARLLLALKQMVISIDVIFEKYNLSFIPQVARYILTACSVLTPLAALAVFLIYGEFETEADNKQKAAKVKQEGTKTQDKKKDDKQAKSNKKGGKDKKQDLKPVKQVEDSSGKTKKE